MNPKERNELIDALLAGYISEPDLLRLEAELSVNPPVRKRRCLLGQNKLPR
jgi:hypothetical protein